MQCVFIVASLVAGYPTVDRLQPLCDEPLRHQAVTAGALPLAPAPRCTAMSEDSRCVLRMPAVPAPSISTLLGLRRAVSGAAAGKSRPSFKIIAIARWAEADPLQDGFVADVFRPPRRA